MTTMRRGCLVPQARLTPLSCGRRPWSDAPRAAGIGDDRLAEGLGPRGALRTPVVRSKARGFCPTALGPLGNVVFSFLWLPLTMQFVCALNQVKFTNCCPWLLQKYYHSKLLKQKSRCCMFLFSITEYREYTITDLILSLVVVE